METASVSLEAAYTSDRHSYSARDRASIGDSIVSFERANFPTNPSFHLQEVPTSYSSVTGKKAANQVQYSYAMFPLPSSSSQEQYHAQPSLHAPSFPSHSHSVESSTNPADQPLDSASRLSCDGDLQIQFRLLKASTQQHQLFPIFYIILCYRALVVKVLPMIQFGRMRTWSNNIIYVHQHHNRFTLIPADILNAKDISEVVLQYLSIAEFTVREELPPQILKHDHTQLSLVTQEIQPCQLNPTIHTQRYQSNNTYARGAVSTSTNTTCFFFRITQSWYCVVPCIP